MYRSARVHPSWRRLQDRPFATALAALLVVSPIVTAFGQNLTRDALEHLVPNVVFWGILTAYFTAGALILLGMGRNKLNWEAAGCVLALAGLAVRFFALVAVLGPSVPVLATGFFYIVFGGACVERIVQCVKGDHIIRVGKSVDLELGVDDAGE